MGKNKLTIILTVIGITGFAGVSFMFAFTSPTENKTKASQVQTYQKNDPASPKAALSTKSIDWGKIKVSDTKISEVTLKNEGQNPLVLTKLSTSCGCTAVKVTADSVTTKEYSMHQSLKDNISIKPGETATLKVIYRPFTMPVEGPVTRQVFIGTNDPSNENLEINASAVVEK